MRQPLRPLLTGSRTWDNTSLIEHALEVLARHPEGVLLVHGADAIAAAYASGHGDTASRRTRRTGGAAAGAPSSSGTPG